MSHLNMEKKIMNYTEAEIFEAICYAVGDDGNKAIKTLKLLKIHRKKYGELKNDVYAKSRKDFKQLMEKKYV